MDVATLAVLRPILILLACGFVPVSIVVSKLYFNHKRSELELESELRKHELTHGAAAMDQRLRAVEAAVHHLIAMSPQLQGPPQQQGAASLPEGQQQPGSPNRTR